MNARRMGFDLLLAEVEWRLEVLTPLHVGSGEKLVLGLDVESADGWTYAVELDRLCDAIPPESWDRLGTEGVGAVYKQRPLRKVMRYALPGTLRGPSFPQRGAVELRAFMRDGFGRPYLPGSTLKGALRTALLGARADSKPSVAGALSAAARPDTDGRLKPQHVDTNAQQAAFRLGSSAESTDDVLRHLHVPDVSIPPDCIEVHTVKFASMAGDRGQWGWKRRRRSDSNAMVPSDREVLTVALEVLRAGTILRVPLRLDVQRLGKNWVREGPKAPVQDFTEWRELLTIGLLPATRAHGLRILDPEVTMWTTSRPDAEIGRTMRALRARVDSSEGEAVFPLGWGIGWRGMTGATLERLDGDTNPRLSDANQPDPPHLADARKPYQLTQSNFQTFPKSRRLATAQNGQPVSPLGWVAVRAWASGDTATRFGREQPPDGILGGPGSSTVRPEHRRPEYSGGRPRWPTPPTQTSSTEARKGDTVLATLQEEKSKKGKWRAKTARGAVGTIEPEGAPEGLAAGQEVELVIKHTVSPGQDWSFTWPTKKG